MSELIMNYRYAIFAILFVFVPPVLGLFATTGTLLPAPSSYCVATGGLYLEQVETRGFDLLETGLSSGVWDFVLPRLSALAVVLVLLLGFAYVVRRRTIARRVGKVHAISSQISNLTTLYEHTRGYRGGLNLDTILNRILAELDRVIDYCDAALLIVEADDLALHAFRGLHNDGTMQTWQFSHQKRALIEIMQHGEPVCINASTNTNDHDSPVRYFLPPDIPCGSLFCMPLFAGTVLVGGLVITRLSMQCFSKIERELLQVFASHAAVGIQNARTALQLQDAAAARERDRIACDLHDAVAQTLFSATMIAEGLPDMWQRDAEMAQTGAENLRLLTRQAQTEMRMLMMELREDALTRVPVGSKLSELIDTFEIRSPVDIDLHVDGDRRLPAYLQIGLYRIVQECLNNVVKHAQAQHAQVNLHLNGRGGNLRICDDGIGFDLEEVAPDRMGLVIIQERVSQISGTLEIQSEPGNGTEIVVSW